MNIALLLYKKIFLNQFLILEGKRKFNLDEFKLDIDLNQVLIVGLCLHLKYIEEDESSFKNFIKKLKFSYEKEKQLEEKIKEMRAQFSDDEIIELRKINDLLKTEEEQLDLTDDLISKKTLENKTNEITDVILKTTKLSSEAVNTAIQSLIDNIDNESSGTKLRLIEQLTKSNSDVFLTINRLQDKQIGDEMRRNKMPQVLINNTTNNDSRSVSIENTQQKKLENQSTAIKDLGSILETIKLLPETNNK